MIRPRADYDAEPKGEPLPVVPFAPSSANKAAIPKRYKTDTAREDWLEAMVALGYDRRELELQLKGMTTHEDQQHNPARLDR